MNSFNLSYNYFNGNFLIIYKYINKFYLTNKFNKIRKLELLFTMFLIGITLDEM